MKKNQKRLFYDFDKVKEIYLASFGMFTVGFALIAWGLYEFKHDWVEGGEYYLMLPLMSFVLLPVLGIVAVLVVLLASTAWFYVKSSISRPKVYDNEPIEKISAYLEKTGFAACEKADQVAFSLEKHTDQAAQHKPFVRIHDNVLTYINFAPKGQQYLFSITYKYSDRNLPSFLINSILNEDAITGSNFAASALDEIPLPSDAQKIFRAYADPTHTNEALRALSPDAIIYLIREGFEFDYYCRVDEITVLFVNTLNISTVDHYLQKSSEVIKTLTQGNVNAMDHAGRLSRLINKAAIVDKQLDRFFFAMLKTLILFVSCMIAFMFAGSGMDSRLGTLASIVAGVTFLVGFTALLALLVLTSVVLYVPMAYALLRSIDWIRKRFAVRKALRAHIYLKQKYSY